jgi:uncharacterized protein DUF3604
LFWVSDRWNEINKYTNSSQGEELLTNSKCASGKDSRNFSRAVIRFLVCILGIVLFQIAVHGQQSPRPVPVPAANPLRNAYFGDLHVHTSYSLDAYSFGNRNDPRAAYRYGRGEAVTLPGDIQSQLRIPLDFMAVTDHDVWLGEVSLCNDSNDSAYNTDLWRDLRSSEQHPTLSSKSMLCGRGAHTVLCNRNGDLSLWPLNRSLSRA